MRKYNSYLLAFSNVIDFDPVKQKAIFLDSGEPVQISMGRSHVIGRGCPLSDNNVAICDVACFTLLAEVELRVSLQEGGADNVRECALAVHPLSQGCC